MSGLLAKARAWLPWRRSRPPIDEPIPWGGFGLTSPFTEHPRIGELQQALGLEPTGIYDEQTAAAVTEAKRARGFVFDDDTADRATPMLLERLGLDNREARP